MKLLGTDETTELVELLRKDVGSIVLFPTDASGIGAAPRIVWRDDGTGDAITWADVMTLIGSQPNAQIWVDQSGNLLAIPPGVYSMRGAYFAAPFDQTVGIDIQDGAQLVNLAGAQGGAILICSPSALPSLVFPDADIPVSLNGTFTLADGALLGNLGSVPACELPLGARLKLFSLMLTRSGLVPPGSAPVFDVTGGTLLFVFVEAALFNVTVQNDTLAGDAISAISFIQDGTASASWPTFAGFAGVLTNDAMGTNGGAGPTAFRPAGAFFAIPVGCRYYNTTLALLEEWDGAAWVAESGGSPARSDKALVASVTTIDGNLASVTGIAATPARGPAGGGYVGVACNGVAVLVGDGTKVAVGCYFSGDGGATARTFQAIVAGDLLYWNQSVAGFNLAATDRLAFVYEVAA